MPEEEDDVPIVEDGVLVGQHRRDLSEPKIGKDAVIRAGTIIYCGVQIGDNFKSGHSVLIRENTQIGDNVLVGTRTTIEGDTVIGSNVSIQTGAFIPTNTRIGNSVFIGPNASLLNDKYPLRVEQDLVGPRIGEGATIGGNATILPGVQIGEGAFVAAGAVVTEDVPEWCVAKGNPARFEPLPERLRVQNSIDG